MTTPPPPHGRAYPPPHQQYFGGAAPAGPVPRGPRSSYASWFARVLAALIDGVPVVVIQVVGWVILAGDRTCIDYADTEYGAAMAQISGSDQLCGASTVGQVSIALFSMLALVFAIWNVGYRQGTTGSSIGKSVMKFRVVGEETGQPIGFGLSIVRQIAHVVDAIVCYVGFLFPLWDRRRQTLADKLVRTVCLPRDSY